MICSLSLSLSLSSLSLSLTSVVYYFLIALLVSGQPDVKITRLSSTSARINWSFKDGDQAVDLLLTYYRKDVPSDRKAREVQANTDDGLVIIENLVPDAKYTFKVQ